MRVNPGAPGWLSWLSIQLLILVQVMISWFMSLSPMSGSEGFSFSLSLCLPLLMCTCSLSLSLKEINLKNKSKSKSDYHLQCEFV